MIFESDKIDGGSGLTFACHGIEQQLQNVVKDAKSRFGDNNILQKSSMRYLQALIKWVNKIEDDHEDQKIISRTGLVKIVTYALHRGVLY